ncbi:tripartite motif-containing protein 9/67 [Mytilus galloprovincialis]|uniref:Tripartite motif-containing protein 9/67 n=1 Tax=Mytilus galloprovincialis TaxID=29158 RepID=A0A8B6DIC1_MYTGA|nr:tripartite motif-containing protein 9/67 [Mytilus galloprovincialis]
MAQNLMVCQFCETSNEPKYKCVNCDLILCEGCKIKIHTKIKKNEVHQVLDLKEFSNLGASETIRYLDLKDIQCSIHNAEQCIIYCEDCKVLLCAVCLLESHRTHNLTKITEVYQRKVKELKEFDDKIQQELPFYADLEKELKKIKTVENDQYTEIKRRILKKESELKEIITKQRENLITELDKLWKPREEEMSRQLKDTAEKYDALTRNKAQIEKTFQSHNATAIFTASGKLNNDLPTRPVNAISEQKLVFSEKKVIDDNKEAFGSILTIPEFKVTETFTSEESIWRIETFADNSNILCLFAESTIKSFRLKNSKCETTSVAGVDKVDIIDMTKQKDNTLLFTVLSSSEIKCLSTFTPDSKIETFTSISPLYANGIHATNKNIFIGFRDNGVAFPLQEKSRRGILVYDYNCRHMRTYEYESNNQRLISLPGAIITNINEDICVIDITNDNPCEGRVVFLGKYGNLKWTYNGHPSINSKNNFDPWDLVTTSKGLILVSDRDSNAVHILSMEGYLVTCLNESHGINRPLCLNINQVGQLQIGCSKMGTKDGLGKLHTVDISL